MDSDGESVSALTDRLIREYRRAMLASWPTEQPAWSFNSCLRQARSIFTKEMRQLYADRGLIVGDLEGFFSEDLCKVVKQKY